MIAASIYLLDKIYYKYKKGLFRKKALRAFLSENLVIDYISCRTDYQESRYYLLSGENERMQVKKVYNPATGSCVLSLFNSKLSIN